METHKNTTNTDTQKRDIESKTKQKAQEKTFVSSYQRLMMMMVMVLRTRI